MANQIPTMKAKILVAGFGALGQAMQKLAPMANVISLNRAVSSAATSHVQADLLDPKTLTSLPDIDYVVFSATPDQRSANAYQATYVEACQNLLSALSKQDIKHFFFISSTSVYGQNQGERVDEQSEAAAASFSGQAIRRGEQLVASAPCNSTAIRFGGIYGNGRSMLVRHVQQGVDVENEPAPLTNRIHETDCAGFILHLIAQAETEQQIAPCYVAVDNDGADKATVYQYIAEQLGSPEKVNLLADRPSNLGKRCVNQLMQTTGYELHYPDYRSGYKAMIHELTN